MKLLITAIILLATPVMNGKGITIARHEYSVATNLGDKLTWKLAGGMLTFEQDGATCKLKNEAGEVIHLWDEKFEVSGAVSSENGTALLVCIMTSKGFYHGITRFVFKDAKWKTDEVMLHEHPNMKIRDRWVHELGAVSDDGATAILHIGEADSDRSPQRTGFRMFYGWQTWDLDKTEKIGTGLKMCNGQMDNKP